MVNDKRTTAQVMYTAFHLTNFDTVLSQWTWQTLPTDVITQVDRTLFRVIS